jgi:hypothetical protein
MTGRAEKALHRKARSVHYFVGALAIGVLVLNPGLVYAAAQSGPSPTTTATTTPGSTTTTTTPGPTLSFTATSPVFVETSSGAWSTRVVLTTTSSCPETLWFWVVLPSNRVIPAASYTIPTYAAGTNETSSTLPNGTSHATCLIPAWQTTPVAVTFRQPQLAPPSTATLVASQAAPGSPAVGSTTAAPGGPTTIVVTTQRFVPWSSLLVWPLVGALLYAFTILAVIFLCLRRSPFAIRKLSHTPVFASAAWTFKDSWATNITAAGALIGTFISATASVTSVFPGVPLYRFSLLSAFCGGVVVIAPLVIGLFGSKQLRRYKTPKDEKVVASLLALSAAAVVTLFGVGAGLAFLGLLIRLSAATPTFGVVLLVGIVLTALVVADYSIRSTYTLCVASGAAAGAMDASAPGYIARLRLGARVPLEHRSKALEAVLKVESVSSAISSPDSTSLTL